MEERDTKEVAKHKNAYSCGFSCKPFLGYSCFHQGGLGNWVTPLFSTSLFWGNHHQGLANFITKAGTSKKEKRVFSLAALLKLHGHLL